MFDYALLLPYLLYVNPAIGLPITEITKNCLIFDSGSLIRSANRVYSKEIPQELEITKVKNYFGDIPFSWVVHSKDELTIKKLEQSNVAYKTSFPAMIINLDVIKPDLYSSDISIKKVALYDSDVQQWISIVAQAFNVSSFELSKVLDLFKQKIPNSLTLYLAFYKGKAAAASMIIEHNSIISLHWVSTLPEFRNKGLGFAVTHKPLLDSKKAGIKQAILLSSALGKSLYQRIGFEEYAVYNVYGN